MDTASVREITVSTRREACEAARALQKDGYGLQESSEIDENGYEFVYVRKGDGATATILWVSADESERPNFVAKRLDPSVPMWQRKGSNETFRTSQEARNWAAYHGLDSSVEIKPLIDVFDRF